MAAYPAHLTRQSTGTSPKEPCSRSYGPSPHSPRMTAVNTPTPSPSIAIDRPHAREGLNLRLAAISPTHGDGRRRPPLLLRRAPAPAPRPGRLLGALSRLPPSRRCGATLAPDRRAFRCSSSPHLHVTNC